MRRALAAGLALAFAGCSAPPENQAVCDAYAAGRSHVEVLASGEVERVLGTQPGVVGPHEGFLLRLGTACRVVVRVEANVDFTGEFALRRGERVTVKGEYEYYPRGGVIHWTHRDPRGHHESGFLLIDGRYYD